MRRRGFVNGTAWRRTPGSIPERRRQPNVSSHEFPMTFRTLTFACLSVVMLTAPLLAGRAVAQSPETSMLRVNITSQPYNFALPWQKQNPGTRRGLGALL